MAERTSELVSDSVENLVRDHVEKKVAQMRRISTFALLVRVLGQCKQSADQWHRAGQPEYAYLFSMAFATGVLEVARSHPERKHNQQCYNKLAATAVQFLARLETIKPQLQELYARASAEEAARRREKLVAQQREALERIQRQRDYDEQLRQAKLAAEPKQYFYPKTTLPPAAIVPEQRLPPATIVPVQRPPQATIVPLQRPPQATIVPVQRPPPAYHQAVSSSATVLQAATPAETYDIVRMQALSHFTMKPIVDNRLQQVVLPSGTVDSFITSVVANTDRGIETCGLLCGRVQGSVLVVSHCVLPKQHGTKDSCAMQEDSMEVFEYTEAHGLITLGWIHTHPTQTVFMSSVDLHTHLPYQQLLAEAVAIVVSPHSKPHFGYFALTQDGLSALAACTKEGHHEHHEPNLYGTPTHLLTQPGKPLMVDLR